MGENINNIKNLLQNVTIIQKKYDEIGKITGENFNIFSVMNMEHSEVNTHSAIIGELMNPKGSHGQGDVFLKIFVNEIKKIFGSDIEIIDFDTLVNDKICERTISIGNNWDNVTGGRIDIIIEDDKQILIIENKIYAIDQPYQLIRYKNYAKTKSNKKAFIFYLTLDGKFLKKNEIPYTFNEISIQGYNYKHQEINEYLNFVDNCIDKDSIHHCLYYPISFEIHIKNWIEKCLEKTHSLPIIRETLVQYLHLIKKLTNQTTNNKMSEEIIKTILSSKENIIGALEISYNINDLKQTICEELFKQIQTKLAVDFDFMYYNDTTKIGLKDSGIYFFKRENPGKKVLLWFRYDYNQLEIGITKDKNDSSWINYEDFESFKDSWENLLDSENIDNAVREIKQYFEKLN